MIIICKKKKKKLMKLNKKRLTKLSIENYDLHYLLLLLRARQRSKQIKELREFPKLMEFILKTNFICGYMDRNRRNFQAFNYCYSTSCSCFARVMFVNL